ncbi:hypothetical protein, partial [Helicobacter pylori]|uniref:hypothetical protein n=1 Tax=Helicobacter pylori TaxID=210 RepID=UPI001E3F466E
FNRSSELKNLGSKSVNTELILFKISDRRVALSCNSLFSIAFFEKKEGAGYKPYKRVQKIKIANHINIDQN